MCVSWYVRVRQHRNRPLGSTVINAHGTIMPVPMGSLHAQTITKSSRAGLAGSRSELVESGAATFFDMAGQCFKSLEHSYQVQLPV